MGKLKRIVAKLLIASQIYGNVFQGVAHAADLADSYEIRNEIHLHSSMDKHGSLRLALGTDGDDSKDLKWIDIPSYQTAKKLAPQIDLGKILEVEEDNLSDGSCGDDNRSTDDESSFECDGVTRNSQAAYFKLQGLNFSISNAGVMVISGSQKDRSKPIFLSGDSPIILNSLDANALEVMAPRIISRGQSSIERLMLTGLDGSQKSVFINDGDLTAKQLFLNNITGDNQGRVLATSLGVIGELESSGVLAVDELALGENSVVKLDEDSRADIKTLLLSKASQLQNQQQAENVLNIGVLHSVGSLGGSITNLGTMAISEVAKDSAFQAITNRHFMGIAQGDLKVETFTNSDAFGLEQGSLQVGNGTNSGVLDANGLEVADEFTNDKTGIITTSLFSGSGQLVNLGKIETAENLALDGQKFTNSMGGSVKAQALTGSTELQKFTNAEGAMIEVAQTLGFADNTKVINQGGMQANAMTLYGGQTTNGSNGRIDTITLNLLGESEFENEGDIDVEQDLYLALSGFTNKDEASLSTGRIYGYEQLITLKNDSGSLFKVRDGPLKFPNTTELINAGTIEAQDLHLSSDQTTILKSGIFRAPSISLTGANSFTNSGQIIASQKLVLDLPSFTNQKRVESPLIDISKITELTNSKGAVIDAKGNNLAFNKAKVVNDGNINAGDYLFKGGSFAQNGRIDGRSLKLEDTVVTTTDTQTINLSGDLEQSGVSSWIMRGKFNARKFFKIGDINLYGTLSLVDSFRGAGTIYQTGKLITKRASFYSNVTLDGDLEVDTLDFDKPASKFNLNGKALIKQHAKIGTLKVSEHGKLQGINGNVLSLSLAEDSEIAGLVDVDNLEADKELSLTATGKLIALKKAKLKADLKIAKGGAANLTGLVMGGTIYNDGELKAVQGSGMSRLVNRGVAEIEADHSTYGQGKDLKLWLRNEKSGQLTLTRGDFDMRGDNPFENAGILIDNSRWMWLGKPQNTGIWYSPSCSLKRYNGMDMGDFRVDGDLTVESLVDALKALEGLQQTKAKKVILHAPKIDNAPTTTVKPVNLKPINKTYPWPLEMRIEGDINNSFEIFAPELSIYSRNFKTSADIFACENSLHLEVADTLDINARIGSLDETVIKAKRLKIFGRESIPGAAAPNVLYKRNGNGIYSKARVRLNITELLENRYGTIHGMYFDITGSKDSQLINLAGLIVGETPYIGSWIKVTNIKNLRDEQGSYTTYRYGVTYNADGKDWCHCHGTRPWHCSSGCRVPVNNTYETSDEGVIFSQGYLRFTYHYLEMLASRITCGKELTFRAEGKAVVYKDGEVPLNTKMIARNNHVNHIVAKKDIKADLGHGDIASSFNGANIFVNAAKLTLQNLGAQPHQLGQVVNLSSQALRALPIETQTLMPSTMVVLGKNADRFNQDIAKKPQGEQGVPQNWDKAQEEIILKDNISALQQAMGSSFYTLYRGIDGLGLDPHQLFKSMFNSVSDHVRGHKATQSHKRYLTSGDQTQAIEVLTNPVITPQDLLDSGILGVFLEFAQNIHSLESEQKANRDIHNATMHLTIPKPAYKTDGLNTKGKAEVTSQDDLSVFTNVRGKNVALVSTEGSTTVGSGTVRHHWGENYHDTLVRTHIEATDNLLIQGHKDTILKAIETKSGIRTDIIAETGMVIDESVATIDHTVTHSQAKDSFTTTKVTNVHQNVSTHQSDGIVNVKAETGILQQGTKNINTTLDAPIIIQDDVHDQRFVESITESRKKSGGLFGSLFNIRETKTTNFNSYLSTSMGCHNSGESFVAMAKERFKAVNPTFGAKEAHIYADDAKGEGSGEIEIKVGANTNQSQTQSIFKGVVWNKSSLKTENHVTHQNPTFEHNVYLHSKKVILEKVRGSKGTFDKIISESEIIFKDVDDIHQSTSKSQKNLTAGASLLISLAVTILTANPAFASSSIPAAMLSAGYGTLCSQAALCLVEKDGNFGKAMNELGKRDIGKTMMLSALSAGLTKGIGDKIGITNSIAFENLAKKHLLQSAINTSMAIAIDGQKPEDAIKQGLTSAAINTLGAYAAGKIGDARSENKGVERIDAGTHKALHALLGAGGGALTGVITKQDIGRSALSGGIGAVLGEIFAELTGNKQLGDLLATGVGFGIGLDAVIAHQTSSNATEYNYLAHRPLGVIEEEKEDYEEDEPKSKKTEKQQADERHRAKHKAELVKFFSKSLSPVRHDTWLQTEAEPVKKIISSNVPDTFKEWTHKTGESLGKKAEKSSNSWQKFKQKPCEKNWSAKHVIRHGAFETLSALGTGVEHVKAYGRRGLRGMGMDANTAQDTMSALDGLTMLAGGTKAVTGLGTLSKQTLVSGTKLANKLSEMTKGSGPRIKAYVKDQFNYREHFAAERLRLEGGIKPSKGGKYFEMEDVKVNIDPKNRSAHELYKQELQREQALRDRIYNVEKQELTDIKDLKDIGFKGGNSVKLKRNNMTGKIQANTDSQDSASYIYRQQVRKFQNEVDVRGLSTTQRIKAPGSTLETVFEDGSRVLLRAESKTGVAKVEITDTYRNIHEKITPISKKEAFK
jgi:hypothetical protein